MDQSQHKPYQFKLADTQSWGLIKRFHKQTKLSTPLQTDKVFYVLNNESLVGVARFVQHHQAWWLRGLYIQPEYRQKHLATQLIEFAFKSLDAPCYAFAQPNLARFYQTLNFERNTPDSLPKELAVLYKRYQTNKPHLQIWLRET
ncbi:MAG: GNAT family N-acetyltransferase [Thiomicrospira sp.]|uniref:GNAT family N-acetyltransferase n=1 Tax=Thiomicrospira sp. TaxID=935 RepID=UPI0019F0B65A|nr:GNAT family N-acetyltransferase [Thiomicrospira sp.]MBE0493590.1 GNAT family N-acetyltransferase [Thiomicrospira sp.]